MKHAAVFVALLFVIPAQADFKTGDYAVLNHTKTEGTKPPLRDTQKWEAGKVSPGKVQLLVTVMETGERISDTVSTVGQNQDDLVDAKLGEEKVKNCAKYKGVVETVKVPAGTFKTCKIVETYDNRSSTSWIGAVPFGFVKSEARMKTGVVNAFELKDYSK